MEKFKTDLHEVQQKLGVLSVAAAFSLTAWWTLTRRRGKSCLLDAFFFPTKTVPLRKMVGTNCLVNSKIVSFASSSTFSSLSSFLKCIFLLLYAREKTKNLRKKGKQNKHHLEDKLLISTKFPKYKIVSYVFQAFPLMGFLKVCVNHPIRLNAT